MTDEKKPLDYGSAITGPATEKPVFGGSIDVQIDGDMLRDLLPNTGERLNLALENTRWYHVGRAPHPPAVRHTIRGAMNISDLTIDNFFISEPITEHMIIDAGVITYQGHEVGGYLPSCSMCKDEGRSLTFKAEGEK
jgi:hypothetical protein